MKTTMLSWTAVFFGMVLHIECVKELIKAGADSNASAAILQAPTNL